MVETGSLLRSCAGLYPYRGLATSEISEVIENELPAVLRAYNLRFLRDLKKNKHLRISTISNANGSISNANANSNSKFSIKSNGR